MKFLLIFLLGVQLWAENPSEPLIKLASEVLVSLQGKPGAIAVLPLDHKNPQEGKVAAEIVVNVANSMGLTIVERDALSKVMQEQALSASGMVQEESAVKIGNLLSAKYLVTGMVGPLMGKENVVLKVIDVESGTVIGTGSTQIAQGQLSQVQKELFGEAGQTSAVVFRSLLLPGWGQFYGEAPVRGTIWLVSGLGLLGTSVWATLNASDKKAEADQFAEDISKSPSVIEAEEKRFCELNNCGGQPATSVEGFRPEYVEERKAEEYDKADDAANLRNILWISTAAVWTVNVLDAWWIGSQRKEKYDMYFSAIPTGKNSGMMRLSLNF